MCVCVCCAGALCLASHCHLVSWKQLPAFPAPPPSATPPCSFVVLPALPLHYHVNFVVICLLNVANLSILAIWKHFPGIVRFFAYLTLFILFLYWKIRTSSSHLFCSAAQQLLSTNLPTIFGEKKNGKRNKFFFCHCHECVVTLPTYEICHKLLPQSWGRL